jgi:hypothetical protein
MVFLFSFLSDRFLLSVLGWLTLLDRLPYKVEKIEFSKNTQKEPYVLT